eukprot:TRINITY_DN8531_c0_g1_i1.p1 TRINITY_DN8531_c0_g1~~TRINITY_DN8531_c0_g1_i1.p1  ORF type:complete len:293 (-),score=9.42 TRINITY_DN8531_c0_g1_i1:134-1012(-)
MEQVLLPVNRTPPYLEQFFPEYIQTYSGYNQILLHENPHYWLLPIGGVALYLLMVFQLPKFIKTGYDKELKIPLAIWNLFLCVGSGLVFFFWISSILPEIIKRRFDMHFIMCNPTGEIVIVGLNTFCGSIFAFSKFFELFDTLFLILRKKPVHFLHWYHHTTVLLYTWYCVMILFPIGNIFGTVNAFVHTVMYLYYFLASIGKTPWWGRYVMRLQLAQMVVGLTATIIWTYFYLSGQNCELIKTGFVIDVPSSELGIIIFSVLLYGSYFGLFLKLYIKRFIMGPPSTSKKQN